MTPPDAPIRWGISSTGTIAADFARALGRVPDAELVAVSSRTADRAAEFAAQHGAPRSYGSLGAMLEDSTVDVVYIASPHSEHCREALLAVEAGKHVLVEKPFGLSAEQARSVFAAASERGVFVMEALWSRFLPAHVRLRELVADGVIGEITGVHASFGFAAPVDASHRLLNPALGGGALLDLGIYSINTAMQLLGPPDRVQATATIGPTGVDVNTSLLLGYSGGAVATASCSLLGWDPSTASISGTLGYVEIPTPQHCPEKLLLRTLEGFRRGEPAQVLDLPTGGDGLRYQVHEVHGCLRRGAQQSDVMSWQHTLDLMTVLDSARELVGVAYPGSD
jgi:predicted dehydrogenase